MQRTEKIGLGIAVAGHILLFACLSLAFHPPVNPDLYKPKPIDVSLAEDVAIEAQAPKSVEPPAQSKSPDAGPPEDAAPPEPQPEPAPQPEKAPAPPKPAPEPAPAPKPKPVAKAEPAPAPRPKPKPEPAPVPKPVPKPEKPKPEKKPVEAKEAKAEPKKATTKANSKAEAKHSEAKPSTAKSEAKHSEAKPTTAKSEAKHAAAAPTKAQTPPTKAKGTGGDAKSTLKRPRGSLLDDDFRKGLTQSPSAAKPSAAAPGAVMNAQAAADIGSAIQRQVQPCAAQQHVSGPGVSRILVKVRLQINRDGSLAGTPVIDSDHGGVDNENERYVEAVDRAAIASFKGCTPLRGLPPELYDVPRGWKSFTLRFHLPG
ncbi:cell envelope integrity protein TolA [Sphingomonas sp. BAUL-RG-20F-R05-02]|uniref:cell envelope integrity protein TolA n=1 Tax=Sphingomonas sp. BAUL-RG-20F-R05-02 TaxID=2914830 RepID=UPI001F585F1F|nr:cell envelope integrity protein TolA [Sphingomonas sp. BAUL-RG-20F-R05-02]